MRRIVGAVGDVLIALACAIGPAGLPLFLALLFQRLEVEARALRRNGSSNKVSITKPKVLWRGV